MDSRSWIEKAIIAVASNLIGAWLLMLLLGAIHSFAPHIQAVGYATVLFICCAFDLVFWGTTLAKKP